MLSVAPHRHPVQPAPRLRPATEMRLTERRRLEAAARNSLSFGATMAITPKTWKLGTVTSTAPLSSRVMGTARPSGSSTLKKSAEVHRAGAWTRSVNGSVTSPSRSLK